MTKHPAVYQAYLLRLWRTADGQWRASLESTRTQRCRGFKDLEALALFVTHWADRSDPGDFLEHALASPEG
jgi:hypothetical protein